MSSYRLLGDQKQAGFCGLLRVRVRLVTIPRPFGLIVTFRLNESHFILHRLS